MRGDVEHDIGGGGKHGRGERAAGGGRRRCYPSRRCPAPVCARGPRASPLRPPIATGPAVTRDRGLRRRGPSVPSTPRTDPRRPLDDHHRRRRHWARAQPWRVCVRARSSRRTRSTSSPVYSTPRRGQVATAYMLAAVRLA